MRPRPVRIRSAFDSHPIRTRFAPDSHPGHIRCALGPVMAGGLRPARPPSGLYIALFATFAERWEVAVPATHAGTVTGQGRRHALPTAVFAFCGPRCLLYLGVSLADWADWADWAVAPVAPVATGAPGMPAVRSTPPRPPRLACPPPSGPLCRLRQAWARGWRQASHPPSWLT